MTVRSLTQREAEERAALLAVERYDIDVDLTDLPTGPELRSTSTVRFTSREVGASTFVDCAAEVVEATLNGEPLGPAEEGRIELPGLAADNVLVVRTVQRETTDGEGVHKAVDPADGEVYLWTSFEPDEARFVWACFDQPDLKARWGFTVTAPAAWRVVSNMEHREVVDEGDALRWSFPDTPPLSSYNPVVLAGPFHEVRREVGGHDLGIFSRRSLASILERDADELFTVTAQGLAFFADAFGLEFPERKYDQVFLPELGGAMENYGCVAWSDAFLRRAEPTHAELELLAKVLLHEMAHMWFGNMVTMRWWDDLWLNEAFAEFACNWAAERATRYTDAWASHLADDEIDAYLADQGPTSHPIRQPIIDVEQAASIFDAITYPKGASVLQQLMTYVGEERFRVGMTAYFAEHAWGSTTLEDLIDALAAASGRDLDTWRRGWLETAGTDRFTLERDGDRFTLVGRGPGGGEPRPHVLAVGAYRDTGAGLERVARAEVEVQGTTTPVELPADADLFLVNDDDLTFVTVRPDAASREVLVRSAGRLPTAISRAVAVATVLDMLVDAEASPAEAVECLTGVLAVETSDAVVEPYIRRVCDVVELWAPGRERADLARAVAATCRTMAGTPGRAQVALRGLARVGDQDDVTWLSGQAGDDVDLAWRALQRSAELGGDVDNAVERLEQRDPDPDAWVRALAVRVARPDAAAKELFWQTAVVERRVPIGAFGQVAGAFWRPGQDELLAPYAERYLELLPGLDAGGMIPAMVHTRRLFPLHGVDTGYLDRAVAAAAGAAPVVRKTLIQQADEVRRMLASRGR
ncbi:aminopeptidase N [Nocardioides caldifontis]|uniref:aminopeptidase N n=1 Tax=Nocardioides caldifontis TaxID=2588938 RepID=UPI0011E00546|nr:aminopeptidase N [Nocardioides caldifontis]